jgi:hypothetical protein
MSKNIETGQKIFEEILAGERKADFYNLGQLLDDPYFSLSENQINQIKKDFTKREWLILCRRYRLSYEFIKENIENMFFSDFRQNCNYNLLELYEIIEIYKQYKDLL